MFEIFQPPLYTATPYVAPVCFANHYTYRPTGGLKVRMSRVPLIVPNRAYIFDGQNGADQLEVMMAVVLKVLFRMRPCE